ncbi:MAG TPA: hypothetical protein VIU12_27120 [Chryseolinea sp.]
MYPALRHDGLSARQWAIEHPRKGFEGGDRVATRFLCGILLASAALAFPGCHHNSQGQDKGSSKEGTSSLIPDSTAKPELNIQVNPRYAPDGALTGFDSVYSSTYSYGDTTGMNSTMKNFDRYFKRNHAFGFDRQLNSLLFPDSLGSPDFFHDDFYMRRYEMQDPILRNMMRRMDSIKNHFYREQVPKKPGKKNEM